MNQETAYDEIMAEFRRKDIGTIADIISGIHVDGCPPGLKGQARTEHVIHILRQISSAIDEELALQEAVRD